jgi:DNA gyrase/topoisomerase IV subunit A
MATNNQKVDPSLFKEKINTANIAEKAEDYQKIYGANKNLYRYFPSMIDGLKPVERRFLYGLYIAKKYHGNLLKLARAATNAVEFHPHGDVSISDVGIALSQEWVNNVPLIHAPGNNGSIRGDAPAAPRYLDVCLSDFAYDCYFKDFANSNVDMKVAYTGESVEPEYLPAKFPVGIINGGFSSIGYAFASNIPPYNFKEVCEATIQLIKDPTSKILLYPDLATGADLIMTKKQAKSLCEDPMSDTKITMRAHAEIDHINNIITFTSIPMQTSTGMIVSALVKLRLAGKFPEIKEVNDRTTDQDGLILQVILDPKANPEDVLERLYKSKAMLKKTNGASITLIDDYISYEYSVRSFLTSWIDYRRDTLRSSFNNRLMQLLEEEHINDIKLFIFGKDNLNKTLEISRTSENKKVYIERLMKTYNISSLQAGIIAGLPTSAFTKDAYQGYVEKKEALRNDIDRINEILKSDGKIDKEIIRELKEGIDKYGTPRKSRIINDENEIISDKEVVVGISEDGYIKKIANDGTLMGYVTKAKNTPIMPIQSRDSDTLVIFDSAGQVFLLPISKIPLLKEKDPGILINKFIDVVENGKVVSVSIAPKIAETTEKYQYVCITKKGIAKRVLTSVMLKSDKTTKSPIGNALILNNDDELSVAICVADLKKELILFTDFGNGVRLKLEDIPLQLPGSKGSKIVNLISRENIVGANLMESDDKFLVYVTSSGKVKKTELKLFPTMQKKDEPLCLVNLDGNEYLVSVKSVKGNEKLTFFKKNSNPETLSVNDIPLKLRVSKAEKMIKCPKGDCVISMVINR